MSSSSSSSSTMSSDVDMTSTAASTAVAPVPVPVPTPSEGLTPLRTAAAVPTLARHSYEHATAWSATSPTLSSSMLYHNVNGQLLTATTSPYRKRSSSAWSLTSSISTASSSSVPSSPSSSRRDSAKLEAAMAMAPPLLSTNLTCDLVEQRSLSPKSTLEPNECEQALQRCRQELREQMSQACQGLFFSPPRVANLEKAFLNEFAFDRPVVLNNNNNNSGSSSTMTTPTKRSQSMNESMLTTPETSTRSSRSETVSPKSTSNAFWS
ncbi:hypothetical protein OIO90_006452 [Microbotryomycetes sp. JL221]|nr:hypothetical protein OIO90_006452 [Microbotryomycetes sp. JL221]